MCDKASEGIHPCFETFGDVTKSSNKDTSGLHKTDYILQKDFLTVLLLTKFEQKENARNAKKVRTCPTCVQVGDKIDMYIRTNLCRSLRKPYAETEH